MRARGVGPTWFCDGDDAARPILDRAGIPGDCIVDVKDHRLLPGEHATEQWRRFAQIMPRMAPVGAHRADIDAIAPGCHLEVAQSQRVELAAWLEARDLADQPLLLLQIGNKRTMRRGLRRMAVNNKYWPLERWAEVLKFLRQRHPRHAILLLGTGLTTVDAVITLRSLGWQGVMHAVSRNGWRIPPSRTASRCARAR